jgi:hypothetical protein
MAELFELDARDYDRLIVAVQKYGDGAEEVINKVLHGRGAEMIMDKIQPLLPVSGRRWKGKKAAASTAQPFRHKDENLSVTVHTKTAYNYLYFPDDGTNTQKHIGNKQFMWRGAEDAADEIINMCLAELDRKEI